MNEVEEYISSLTEEQYMSLMLDFIEADYDFLDELETLIHLRLTYW